MHLGIRSSAGCDRSIGAPLRAVSTVVVFVRLPGFEPEGEEGWWHPGAWSGLRPGPDGRGAL
jgi:hypothetical protein